MESVDYLIIGGGVAGTVAAETLRSEDAASRIVIIEDEKYPLYSRVQIPYYLRGIKTREGIFLRTFEDYQERRIEYNTSETATTLDAPGSVVKTNRGREYKYGKLLITTGGSPRKLSKYPNGHSMQTIEDADSILEALKVARRGVIIGSGFIALEFLETFLHRNLEISLCVSGEGFWSRFLSREVSDHILSIIGKKGVTIFRGDVPEIQNGPEVIVGIGVGLEMSRSFFELSGLNFEGGLVTDATLKTSIDNIYAAGDVAKFWSGKLGRYVRYGNWTNATVSGKTAGLNMLGKNVPFDYLSAYSLKSEGLSLVFLGFAGNDEKTVTKTKIYSETECAQFFIRDGRLDGCVLVNRPADRQMYQKIIESREPF